MFETPLRILAIETSGRSGSAALCTSDGVIAQASLSGQMRHAAELLPAVHEILERHGWEPDSINEVYVSIGPGSFTGLRIGVTVARTLAWSIGARIVAVPTLDTLARNALNLTPPPGHVAVVLDAKRSQVYAACFELREEGYLRIEGPTLSDPALFLERCPRPLSVVGEGIDYHRAALEASGVALLERTLWPGCAEHVFTVGRQLAQAGAYAPTGDLLPLYIRRPEAEEKWEARQRPSG